MRSSELVTTQHLARKAVIYVRQSTPHQVLTNSDLLPLIDERQGFRFCPGRSVGRGTPKALSLLLATGQFEKNG